MPTVEEALQIGWKQHQSGDVRGAEHVYRQVLQAAPGNENAWCFLGMVCHDQARYDDAVEAYGRALEIRAEFPVALSNLGNTLKQLGRLDEAIASCQRALDFKPDYSTAYNNLGVAYVAKGDLDLAKTTFEKSLDLMPNGVVAHSNLGAALVRQGDYEAGTARSEAALKIDPKYAEAHKNLAIVWLLMGDFERGWPEYEWRWRCPGNSLPSIKQPMWDGTPLQGRTILLVAEQGLGDTLHFVRYAKVMQKRGARVIVAAQKPLLPILAECQGIDQLVKANGSYPSFDTWAPLVSLPGLVKTTLASIPAEVPYLAADPTLVKEWSERLAAHSGFRIGITWQGSPDFHADRQRSIPLRLFAALAEIPGVQLFSLQKGFGSEQIAALNGQFDVVDFGDELDGTAGPFMDSAAIMQNMDLLVSSDTSVPHLAGALGLETWLALSMSPDWRWLLGRDDSPWYPSMRLFRQQTLGAKANLRRPTSRHVLFVNHVTSKSSKFRFTPADSIQPNGVGTVSWCSTRMTCTSADRWSSTASFRKASSSFSNRLSTKGTPWLRPGRTSVRIPCAWLSSLARQEACTPSNRSGLCFKHSAPTLRSTVSPTSIRTNRLWDAKRENCSFPPWIMVPKITSAAWGWASIRVANRLRSRP
jgi:Flp pilus assembly protein TadD